MGNAEKPSTELVTAQDRAIDGTEHSQSALAAHARAEIESRLVVAKRFPRSWDDVRVKLLAECRRPTFAAKARYAKPQGSGKIYGPSIRFAEAAARLAGNLDTTILPVFEDRQQRVMRVSSLDYETNTSYSEVVYVQKRIERKDATGRVVISERLNSSRQKVFIVEPTDDEMLTLKNAQCSKAIRNLILRLVPGDLVEEGQLQCIATQQDQAAKDPGAAKKALLDAFASIGVQPKQIEEYIGHGLDVLQPKELVDLRAVFQSIRDGESTWQDESAEEEADDPKGAAKAKAADVAASVAAKAEAMKKGRTTAGPPVAETGEICRHDILKSDCTTCSP